MNLHEIFKYNNEYDIEQRRLKLLAESRIDFDDDNDDEDYGEFDDESDIAVTNKDTPISADEDEILDVSSSIPAEDEDEDTSNNNEMTDEDEDIFNDNEMTNEELLSLNIDTLPSTEDYLEELKGIGKYYIPKLKENFVKLGRDEEYNELEFNIYSDLYETAKDKIQDIGRNLITKQNDYNNKTHNIRNPIDIDKDRIRFKKSIIEYNLAQKKITKNLSVSYGKLLKKYYDEIELKENKDKPKIYSSLNEPNKRFIGRLNTYYLDARKKYDKIEVDKDFQNVERSIKELFLQIQNLQDEEMRVFKIQVELNPDTKPELDISRSSELIEKVHKLEDEFKEKYDIRKSQDEILENSDVRTPAWYHKKLIEYVEAAKSLPGAPASIHDTFKSLIGPTPKFTASKNEFGDFKKINSDHSLIKQVASGVKPLAHTHSVRRHMILKGDEAKYLAYVLAPDRMGGGAIWYRPNIQANWKFYDERIKGANPEADKEERPTKPYDPFKRDPNFDIVKLYIWNNISNTSDPKLYNFINGLCLGYHKHFVVWYCESEYGQTDTRQPEQTMFERMIDRMRYCIRGGINGYGRPGTLKKDGMFGSVLKLFTGQAVNFVLDSIADSGTADTPYKEFIRAADTYNPPQKGEAVEFDDEDEVGYNSDRLESLLSDINRSDDPIVESIFNKLDNI
jgi:hypothetical protein